VPVTIGVNEVGASDRVRRILGDGYAGAGAPGDVFGEPAGAPWAGGARPGSEADVAAHQRTGDQQGAAHGEPAVAAERVAIRLAAGGLGRGAWRDADLLCDSSGASPGY
jgi:hypothetical protein